MADSVKIKITGDASQFQQTLSSIGQSAGSVFKGIMGSQLVTAGFNALTSGLKDAVNTGMQFEASMSQVAAISGATGAELARLTETAKHYGETTMFSASQAAEALNYMALAGWDTQQSIDALGGVLDLAAASGMELGAASDAVTDYLSAFSMEAGQAGYMADLMAYAQARSNTTATMLADAYGNCAATMHAGGQDIETTTAMLMALANQGIKGSEAGTQMSAVMRDLTQKMENGKVMIGDTAVAVQDTTGNFRDLTDIMADVSAATEGMGTAEKSAALMETFTARSVKAVQTLLNEGVESVNQYEEALRGSEGTAAQQAKVMMDNLQGDVKIFQSALEGVQITASETFNDTARAIVQEGTGVLEAINEGGKSGGLGGMADALIGQIPKLLPKAVQGVEQLFSGIGQRLPDLARGLISTLPDILGGAGELAPVLIESLTDAAAAAAEGLIGNLPEMLGGLLTALPDIMQSLGKGALNIGEGLWKGLSEMFGDVDYKVREYEGLKGHVTGEIDVDVSANVSYAEAQAEIDAQLNSFIDQLQGYGLTTEQVAQVLAFKGTQAELEAFLMDSFPNLDEAARNAILEKIPKDGWADSLKGELGDMGIKPEDIAELITAQEEGDTATIEKILGEKYGDIKQQAIDAIRKAWDSSPATFGAENGSGSFAAKLITDMFTDGVTDDAASVDDGLEVAKGIIDAKIQALRDYIAQGGADQEGAQAAIEQYDQLGNAINQYASDYANAATAECETAGKALLDLANTCDETAARILSASQAISSYQGNVFNAGAGGEQLSDEDALQALNYIKNLYNERLAAAEQAKQDAVNAGKDYTEAETAYSDAVSGAMSQSKALLAQLIQGQSGSVEGAQLVQAMAQVKGQFMSGLKAGTVSPTEIAGALREAGYEPTVISQALETLFHGMQFDMGKVLGEESFVFDDSTGFSHMSEQLEEQLHNAFTEPFESGLDVTDAQLAIEAAYDELGGSLNFGNVIDALLSEGFDMSEAQAVAFELFGQTGEVLVDSFDSAMGEFDFGPLGNIVQEAINAGLIDGLEDYQHDGNTDINALIMDMLSGAFDLDEPPKADVPVDTIVTDGEIDTSQLEDGVEQTVEETAKRDRPRQHVKMDADVEPGDVDTGPLDEGVQEAAGESGEGEPVEAERDVTLQPGEVDTQALDEGVQEAADGASGGEGTTETVNATADINVTVGNVSVEGSTDVGAAIGEQLSGQTVPVSADVSVTIGNISAAEGTDIATTLGEQMSGQVIPVDASVSATLEVADSNAEDVGASLSEAIAGGISGNAGAISTAAGGAVNDAVYAATAAAGSASEAGSAFGTSLAGGISGSAGTVSSAASGTVSGAVTAASGAASGAASVGSTFGNNIAGGIRSSAGSVSSAASGAVSSAVSAASGAASGASAVGAAIARGIASGITANSGAIAAAARAAAAAAVAAAKASLAIHSPSAVMRDEVGRNYALGFAAGIEDNATRVVQSALRLSNQVAGAINTTPSVDVGAIGKSFASNFRPLDDDAREYVFAVDGNELARVISNSMSQEINSLNRRVSVQYGSR